MRGRRTRQAQPPHGSRASDARQRDQGWRAGALPVRAGMVTLPMHGSGWRRASGGEHSNAAAAPCLGFVARAAAGPGSGGIARREDDLGPNNVTATLGRLIGPDLASQGARPGADIQQSDKHPGARTSRADQVGKVRTGGLSLHRGAGRAGPCRQAGEAIALLWLIRDTTRAPASFPSSPGWGCWRSGFLTGTSSGWSSEPRWCGSATGAPVDVGDDEDPHLPPRRQLSRSRSRASSASASSSATPSGAGRL